MATTVATAVADIQNRLILGATTQEPSSAMLTTWLRDAFQELWGTLPSVKRTKLTVASQAAALTADIVYYVTDGVRTLFPDVEWGHDGTSVNFDPGVVANGGSVTVWYAVAPDFTGATIDTSGVFGTNWLEELATEMAVAQAYQRISNTAASQSEGQAAAAQRVEWNDKIDRLYKWKAARFAAWQASMEQGYQRRAQMGDLPRRTTPYGHFLNKSSVENSLTGVRTGS